MTGILCDSIEPIDISSGKVMSRSDVSIRGIDTVQQAMEAVLQDGAYGCRLW